MEFNEPAIKSQPYIDAYGDGGFRLGGARQEGSILVLPNAAIAWDVSDARSIGEQAFQPVIEQASLVEILIIGTGEDRVKISDNVQTYLRKHLISLDFMATGPACRTYNVLLAEDRRVAAALISVE